MECILNRVSSLTDLEKLVLYLQLPTGIGRQPTNSSSTSNGSNTESSKPEIQVANRWIKTRLQLDKDVCLAKEDVYHAYKEYCDKESQKWVNQADFGKLIKGIYPGIRTRRLGNRGQSKHCYGGLSMHFEELPVPDYLSIEIPTSATTPKLGSGGGSGGGSSVKNDVLAAACVVVCEWASKVLEQDVSDVYELAQYLVARNLVTMCSSAALTVSAAASQKKSQPKASDGGGSAPSTPTTPVPGKQREAQIQLQRKLQEKEQLKKQKEKQRNMSAESTSTQPAPSSTTVVNAPSSTAVQQLMLLSPAPGSATATTSSPLLLLSPQDKPPGQQQQQHKPKNKYNSKTVSFLLQEKRGLNAQDKDDKLAYVNDTRPVSQLLKESRERKNKSITSAMKASAPPPILIKPMSPKSQDKLPSNGKPQQIDESSLFDKKPQVSASEILQTFSQLQQQQQQQSDLNSLNQQFSLQQQAQVQQQPLQLQQQQTMVQQHQLQIQQPLLQQSMTQQSMLQQQQDNQQLQQLQLQSQQQQGQEQMMQQQMQQLQQQLQQQQPQQQPMLEEQLMQPRQTVDFNPQYEASYSNVNNNSFDQQFVASPGSGSGSMASATSTPMLSPACLSPMLSSAEPSNVFTPIQHQHMQRGHTNLDQNMADSMSYTNNNNNPNQLMKNMMFRQGIGGGYMQQQQVGKRSMTQMQDASKRRRHCSAPNKPVSGMSGMFANPNTLSFYKEFPGAMQAASTHDQQAGTMNMLDTSSGYTSNEQWATQPSPEVATILQQQGEQFMSQTMAGEHEAALNRSRSVPVPALDPVIDDIVELLNETAPADYQPTSVLAPCKNLTNQAITTQPLQDNSNNNSTTAYGHLLLQGSGGGGADEKSSSPYISTHRGDHMISGASVAADTPVSRMKRLAACKYDK